MRNRSRYNQHKSELQEVLNNYDCKRLIKLKTLRTTSLACTRTSYKWNHTGGVFCPKFILLKIMVLRFVHGLWFVYEKKKVLVAQSYTTLCNPWTVAHQAPLSMEFSRQKYWSGQPFPSLGDLPAVYSFLLTNNSPLYECITVSEFLSICVPMKTSSGWCKIFPSLLPPRSSCHPDIHRSRVNRPIRILTFMSIMAHTALRLWTFTESCAITNGSFSSLLTSVLVLLSTCTSFIFLYCHVEQSLILHLY